MSQPPDRALPTGLPPAAEPPRLTDAAPTPPYPGPAAPDPRYPAPPPQYPGAADAPAYAAPAHPADPAHPAHPATDAPAYPAAAHEPRYPDGTGPAPQYPAAPVPAPWGTAPREPQYPGAPAAPPYPGAQDPGAQTAAPAYPEAALPPPAYPDPAQAAPPPPTYPGPAPAYPGQDTARAHPGSGPSCPNATPAHPATGPAYPNAGPAYPNAMPPGTPAPHPPAPGPAAYAGPPAPEPRPAAGPTPGTAPGTAAGTAPGTAAEPAPEPAPDDLDYRHRGARLHVAEHQRGADATAIGRLAVQLPGALVSLAVVGSIAVGVLGSVLGWIVTAGWVVSGALVFHRPAELAFARHVLKLRAPTPEERARLERVWREVTARAGIEAHTYELMVENSDELNAVAVAGHVVGVTTYALDRIPSANLAAVLAHELGHHTGGHAWAGLLGYWYSLPGRIAWAVMRGLARLAIVVAGAFSAVAAGFVYLFIGMTVVAGFLGAWYITIPLVAAPYLLAYAGRRGELRADQQAAELGFAGRLAEVIHHFRTEEETAKAAAVARGEKLREPGTLDRLLSTHPDHETRLGALEPYLRLRR
ncbi:M48 family metalloprotease [Streptomyces sp. NPDC004065]|uniref:M48 family metalloprotease n=1 Tax=Streptomyces sp. NPDC004065 TaxID=3364689 RepID=UPI00384FDBD1